VQQQKLVHQPQQQGSLPVQYHPIQHLGYGIIPAQHTTYMNVQPSQPNQSATNDSATRNNIGKRKSEGEQEVENETALKWPPIARLACYLFSQNS
jgi:hypothetical protein